MRTKKRIALAALAGTAIGVLGLFVGRHTADLGIPAPEAAASNQEGLEGFAVTKLAWARLTMQADIGTSAPPVFITILSEPPDTLVCQTVYLKGTPEKEVAAAQAWAKDYFEGILVPDSGWSWLKLTFRSQPHASVGLPRPGTRL